VPQKIIQNNSITLGKLIDDGAISIVSGFPCGKHNDRGEGVLQIRPYNVSILGAIDLTQQKHVPVEFSNGRPTLKVNDIIFNNTNTLDLVGKTALWDGPEGCTLSNHITRVRVISSNVDPRFLSIAIHAHWLTGNSRILARAHVAQASILGERFREIEIPWPPTGVQRALSAIFESLQKALEVESRQIDLTTQLKQSAMRELFTRGLRGEPQKETEFSPVPDSWSIESLKYCAFVQTGVAKGRKLKAEAMVTVPYLRVANVQDGHLDLTEMKNIEIRRREIERYSLQDGDVVLTEGGDFDKLGRGFIWRSEIPNCVHQNHVFAVRTDRKRLGPEFLAYLAQSPYGKAYFLKVAHKTTNLASINKTKLEAFPVLLPGLEEQSEIVEILSAIDAKIDLHKRKKAILEELFKSLLHKLMSGEIRVNDLDLSALKEREDKEAAA
jgi:type I restriction enzyme S subunit